MESFPQGCVEIALNLGFSHNFSLQYVITKGNFIFHKSYLYFVVLLVSRNAGRGATTVAQ